MVKIVAVAVTDLTEPEQALWQAFPRGAWVDLRDGAPDRAIRAEVIRALLLGAADREPGHTPGVRIRGARVTGRLDLMGATVTCPLVCEHCDFEQELRFVESVTRTVRIVQSRLPAFNGTRMRLDGILNLWTCEIAGVLRLDQAKITGQLCLEDAVIGPPGGGAEAVAASGLTVDGSAQCARLISRGPVTLTVAEITGSLELTGARLSYPGQRALAADRIVIGGRLDGRGMRVAGETLLRNAHVRAGLVLVAAALDNPGGVALNAGGLTVDGGVFLTGGFGAAGEVRLLGAHLGANLTLSGAELSNPGGIALNLDRATMSICTGTDMTCTGQASFTGARIGGDLNLRGARLTGNTGDPALFAEHISIDGELVLSGLRAHGEVRLRTARVGHHVLLTGAQLDTPGGVAFRLSRAQVGASVVGDGMRAAGEIRVAGTTIGGELSFRGARLRHPGTALEAGGLQATELWLHTAEPVAGLVDLDHAQIGILRDDPACWPAQLSIDGLTYQSLEPRLPARQRLDWLNRDPRGHQTQPYEQLAAHYTTIGQPGQAREVMYARERVQRTAMSPLARAWSLLQDVTVGYGYQPRRAVAWLVLLLAVGSITFALAPPPVLVPGQAPHFNPVVYTLDLLLPVVDLGQKHAFNPSGAEQWLSYLLTAAGWVLVTTVAAGAARVLSRR
jgi:hypothetical protein